MTIPTACRFRLFRGQSVVSPKGEDNRLLPLLGAGESSALPSVAAQGKGWNLSSHG